MFALDFLFLSLFYLPASHTERETLVSSADSFLRRLLWLRLEQYLDWSQEAGIPSWYLKWVHGPETFASSSAVFQAY